jgi:hypothetical protein
VIRGSALVSQIAKIGRYDAKISFEKLNFGLKLNKNTKLGI